MNERVRTGAPGWVDAVDQIVEFPGDEVWCIGVAHDVGRTQQALVLYKSDGSVAYTNGTTAYDMAALIEYYRADVGNQSSMLSTSEVADELNIPRDTLLSLLKRKPELRPSKIGRAYGWAPDDIDAVKPHLRVHR